MQTVGANDIMPSWLRQAQRIFKHHKPVTREVILYNKLLAGP